MCKSSRRIPHTIPRTIRSSHTRKGWYSIILQGVLYHKYRFLGINVGWPGSVHGQVVCMMHVYLPTHQFMKKQNLEHSTTWLIAGENVPLYIIGHSAYPLLMWLMKPFPHSSHLSDDRKTYNYRMSRTLIVVENLYARLKGRWRHLTKKNEMSIANIPIIISS